MFLEHKRSSILLLLLLGGCAVPLNKPFKVCAEWETPATGCEKLGPTASGAQRLGNSEESSH